ncbi:MAG: DEAD/DEAH box helicase, partial [Ilumatobacteraceae bacterium]|nr:DEAD/DEAH box helicase [Ilumatobacteraceae bacterium]
MSVYRVALHARAIRRQLVAGLRRVRDAQRLLDESHERVVRAQESVAAEGNRRGLPDPTRLSAADTELICAVDEWLHVRQQVQAPLDEIRQTLHEYEDCLSVTRTRRAIARSLLTKTARTALPMQVALADTALAAITRVLDSRLTRTALSTLARRQPNPAEALARYRRNNAYFAATLEHFRSRTSDVPRPSGVSGGLPAEIASRVETTQLLPGAFTAILRKYQEFGARYAITQKRVILADEMGLGKTVQALAAICHAHALGARRFLVVAPNSVMINWEREIEAHTSLKPAILHGLSRDEQVRAWTDSGRIGITTFGTIAKIAPLIDSVDVLVVDEAHHVKNPDAQRTSAVQEVAAMSEHVILMTGTALENRLSELNALALLAQPELRDSVDGLSTYRSPDPTIVATMLAPVYL